MKRTTVMMCVFTLCIAIALCGCSGQAASSDSDGDSGDASSSELASVRDKDAPEESSDASLAATDADELEEVREYTLAGDMLLGEIKLPSTWVRYFGGNGELAGGKFYANTEPSSSAVSLISVEQIDGDFDSYGEELLDRLAQESAEVIYNEAMTVGDHEALRVVAKAADGYVGYYAIKVEGESPVEFAARMSTVDGDEEMQRWLDTYYTIADGSLDETSGVQEAGDNLLGTITVPLKWKLSHESASGEPHSLTYSDTEGFTTAYILGDDAGPDFIIGEFEGSLEDMKAPRESFYNPEMAEEVRAEDLKCGEREGWVLTFSSKEDQTYASVYGISQESGGCVYILAMLTDDATSFDQYVKTYEPGIGEIESVIIKAE